MACQLSTDGWALAFSHPCARRLVLSQMEIEAVLWLGLCVMGAGISQGMTGFGSASK
jgi:hypothetical protein